MKKNDNTTKAILAVMGLSLIGQGAYVYKQSADTKDIKEQIGLSKNERSIMLDELSKGKSTNDSIMEIHSNLVSSLEKDKQKVASLSEEIRKSNLRLEKLSADYNKLKTEKSLFKNNSMLTLLPTNINTKEATAEQKARRRELAKIAKDSIARVKSEAIALKRIEEERVKSELAERKRGEAIEALNKKIEAEKVKNEIAERKKLEAIEVLNKKNESIEKSRLEAIAASKNAEVEKARLAEIKRIEEAKSREIARLESIAASKNAEAEKSRLAAIALAKRNEEAKANESSRLAAIAAAKNAEAEKARLAAIALAKRNEEAKANESSRLAAIAAAKNAELEKARLASIRKNEDDKARENERLAALAVAKSAELEKARLASIALNKKNEEVKAIENARLATIEATKKAEAEKSRLAAIEASKKAEAAMNPEDIALKNRLDVMAQNKKNAIAKLKEKNKTDAAKTKAAVGATPSQTQSPSVSTSPSPVRKPAATPELEAKLSKIKIVGLDVSSYKYVDEESKEEEETDDASEVKFLKVNFTIPQNFVVRASDRNYYIQVTDEDDNLIGDNATETFEDTKISYCFRTNIKYKNKAVKVSENLYFKNLKEGTYTVKIYDRKDMVSQMRVVLN